MAIRVIVADAQPLFSESLAIALDRYDDLDAFTERDACGPDAVETIHRERPDVALIDFWMPGIDGPESSVQVLEELRGFKVIFLSWFFAKHSWFDPPGDIERALAAGAVGFLAKHYRVGHVAAAVCQAHLGESPVFRDDLEILINRTRRHREQSDEKWRALSRLTRREIEIIGILATGATVKEAADALSLAPVTIQTHVQRILMKTGTHSRGEVIATARNYGII